MNLVDFVLLLSYYCFILLSYLNVSIILKNYITIFKFPSIQDEANPNKMYNTHLIIDNEGEIVQAYRKLHLFDVEIPKKKLRLKESDFSHEGGHIVSPVDTPVGKVGK